MNFNQFLIAALIFFALPCQHLLADEDIDSIGFLPGFKKGLRLPAAERNPYSERKKNASELPEDGESEAARIREILQGLRVRGISNGPRGMRVLFGNLVLIAGVELPQLLPGQLDRLMCTRVTDKDVEVAWLSEAGEISDDGRKILITIDLEPTVTVILPGQLNEGDKQRAVQKPGSQKEADVSKIGVAGAAEPAKP